MEYTDFISHFQFGRDFHTKTGMNSKKKIMKHGLCCVFSVNVFVHFNV